MVEVAVAVQVSPTPYAALEKVEIGCSEDNVENLYARLGYAVAPHQFELWFYVLECTGLKPEMLSSAIGCRLGRPADLLRLRLHCVAQHATSPPLYVACRA